MKKMLFTALVAACAMTACGTKTTETAAAAEEATREIGSSDIAYVQVEAVLAQCDLFLNEGKALQEKTQKAQKSWAQKEQNLQSEAAQLQEKYQKGLITTNDAQAQQQSIEKRVAAYQSSAQKEAQALDEENFVFTNRRAGYQRRQEVQADHQLDGPYRRRHDAQHHPRRAGEGKRAVCGRPESREEISNPVPLHE